LNEIIVLAKDISFINSRMRLSNEIGKKADQIAALANKLKE